MVQTFVESIQARNAERVLELVTDRGLEGFDWGTRQQVAAGEGSFGQDDLRGVTIAETTVDGDTGDAVVDLVAGIQVVRLRLPVVREDGAWKVDGVEFLGAPPPAPGQRVVEISAGEYAFTFDRTAAATGDFAITFTNRGKEAHEMSMFRAPADVPLSEVAGALGDVDGAALDQVPPPFELVSHLAFAEPGQSVGFRFAEPLTPGRYVIVCYIPQGTTSEDQLQDPSVTGAIPHVKLGMIADFKVDA
jgi:plastocyanin